MRRRDRYGYHTYYGGGGPSPVIKVIVIVLAVVVLSLILTIWGLQRYMVYSSDGGKLELPWAQQTDDGSGSAQPQEGGAASEPDVSAVVTSGGSDVPQEPANTEDMVRAVPLTREELLGGDVSGLLEQKGANGVVLEMKESSGKLAYASQLDMARELGVSELAATGQEVAQAVRNLKDQGTYLIAYVDCFQDHAMSGKDAFSFSTTYGYHWMDDTDVGWGNPTKTEVRDYLTGIVGELAAMGFDEILLDNAGYPTRGNLEYIQTGSDYDATQFASVIGDFYTKAAQAAAAGGAKLSAVTDQSTIQTGSNAHSGQTLENLSGLSRVWLTPDAGADVTALTRTVTEAGMNDYPLGVLTSTLETGRSYYQAVLAAED